MHDVTHLLWRLRNNATAKDLCRLAADEIERMWKINAELVNDFNTLLVTGARQDDEIKRLKDELEDEKERTWEASMGEDL